MNDALIKKCATEIEEIAGSLAGIRGLLHDPEDPLLPNYLSVIDPALQQLEEQLVTIAQLLSKKEV